MNLIVAINKLGYIGKDNQLMWKSKADMKYFKELTTHSIVVMGRKTFESMGNKPLKNRNNIIVGSDYLSLNSAIETAKIVAFETGREIWIIGGSTIYKQCLDMCDNLYISIINDDQIGDVKFEFESFKGHIELRYFDVD
jgi:dihydrofolate reductase